MSTIPPELLKKIRRIEIQTHRLAADLLAGQYLSVFKGRGMDFEEVREYQPGDEVKRIDWNVSARMDNPHVKVFREERELTVMILVDLSASCDLGSSNQSKRELMAEVASVMAFSAIRNSDRVGLILFTDQVEKYVPPGKGRTHVLRVIREILFSEPAGRGTDIPVALNYLNQVVKKRSIVFLISDFLSSGFERSLKATNQRHDLIAMIARDQREHRLPNVGWITLEDAETGEILEVNTSNPRIRDEFAKRTRNQLNQLTRQFSKANIDSIQLNTDRDFSRTIRLFFETRNRRRAK
ncbi:MAG: DUF58 domain-containing protein [Verrucomicrobiota bacterium]